MQDTVKQFRTDRNQREQLFEFGWCISRLAVDESEVRFCTHLRGKASWFLPFDRCWNDAVGNSRNPNGLKADYLKKSERSNLASLIWNKFNVSN